ncbi:zinc-alpha-2-glycoprotein-like [Macrotis lagotis]|uniref:zinc-alpha-2-glycoprotein-like n=1 Tax=Macrotis lagotis TaxID=92651 RepID=UPI003D6983AA
MGSLKIVFFLLLFSGTTVVGHGTNQPRQGCYSLTYKDYAQSKPIPLFTNEAYFNKQLVYKFSSNTSKAVPEPEWVDVEDWNKESQVQEARGIFAMENLEEIMAYDKDVNGSHVLSGHFGCKLCKDDAISVFWNINFDGKPFITFNPKILAWIPKVPTAEIIKKKWEEDPGAVNRTKDYLEKECIEKLKQYRDHQKTN